VGLLLIKKSKMKKFLEKYVNNILLKMFASRKFWYTIVGILTSVLSEKFNLNADEVKGILLSISTLVLGQGIADIRKK
jgi:hypothetical protein|tara:strand:+ start:1041 stop:1274 length:234 start_codon:yes stop_codon:yes gene_type:complete